MRYFYLAAAGVVVALTLWRVFQASAPPPEGAQGVATRETAGAE